MFQCKHGCYEIYTHTRTVSTANSISAPNELSYAKRSCFAPVFIELVALAGESD